MLPTEGANTEEEIVDLLGERLDILDNQPVTDKAQDEAEDKPEEDVSQDVESKEETEDKVEEEQTEDDPKDDSEDAEKDKEPEKEAKESTLTLAEIAEVLGVDADQIDVDDNGKVVMLTKIDGVEGRVSLAEARKSYQLEGHLNKQNMEVVEQRKALEVERSTFLQEQQQKTQQLEDTIALAVTELNRDYQSVDWEFLKVNNPTEFMIKKQDYQERQQGLERGYQQLLSTRQEESEKFHVDRQQKLVTETQRLRTLIPGWDDEKTFKTGTTEVRDTLLGVGFSEQEVEAASQGLSIPPEVATRMFQLAYKAGEYDKLQKAKLEAVNIVRKAPKIVKGGVPSSDTPKTSLKKAQAAIRKSGKVTSNKSIVDALAAKGL